ncbi:unnamed protein product [Parnassius apollo]|uniref:(apollo) hypothetical protein n=1 Tax=Parnassius apollo TaxID=110799 RepID=A0A8S3WWM8_PARAO|nr:unnamed protein product [Parnassius apollo]
MAFRNDEELERYLNNMVEDDDSKTEPLEAEKVSENEDNLSVHSEQDDIISCSDEDDVPLSQLRGSILKGKETEAKTAADYVTKLAESIKGSGRNITFDNWFTSVPLADQLLKEYRLTCIGTLRKNIREIPPAFLPNKSKSALSSQFAFDREKTLVSFTPKLIASVKTIQADLSDLKDMKCEMMDVKNSLNHVHTSVEGLTNKLTEIDREIQSLQKTKDDVVRVEHRLEKLEADVRENQQRSRLNNIEIKGVPVASSENLFTIFSNIGSKIGYEVPKEQINCVARVPQRNNKNTKNIIVSLHTRYLRDNFIAAAKKCKTLTAADLGLRSDSRIFINDHLTFENKQLLNKTKALASEKFFSYTWRQKLKPATGSIINGGGSGGNPRRIKNTTEEIKQ